MTHVTPWLAHRMFDPRYRLRWLLVVSGIIGFRLGFHFAEWQAAVETAQVVAGIVHYPAGNPFYIYHQKLWTVLPQMSALALVGGLSEITVSRIISGLMEMMMFQGWVLLVYALSLVGIVAGGLYYGGLRGLHLLPGPLVRNPAVAS